MNEERNREPNLQNAAPSTPTSGTAPDLATVFREHHLKVLRAARRITGNNQDAEDVLQTVFMRLARREGGSPLSDSPASYLHRAAVNAALDVVRSRQAARSTALENVEGQLTGVVENEPDQQHAASEMRERIRRELSTMSPKSAEIFALRYFEGYGNHEIARMLGTSRSTVNVILHRTREKLKERIGDIVGEGQ